MRYPDGGGLTAAERARSERVRLAAAEAGYKIIAQTFQHAAGLS